MPTREGNLEAPTRHPLEWRSADFHDEPKLYAELERVFDICHGCRRCVSLCTAFPRLFDLIDESSSGEIDGVDKKRYWDVVDQCYLCDMCYVVKCPYVPPHAWNVDFPHLMLRAKAVKFRKGETRFRDKLLSSTDAIGKLAAIPVVAQTVNAVNRNGAARAVMEQAIGVHRDRRLPPYSPSRFRTAASASAAHAVRDGERTPGKVAVFATCYVNYNEPGIGHDLLKILEHNAIPYVLAEKEACCGMPKLELGDLDSVARLKEINIPVLARLARGGTGSSGKLSPGRITRIRSRGSPKYAAAKSAYALLIATIAARSSLALRSSSLATAMPKRPSPMMATFLLMMPVLPCDARGVSRR